MIIWLQNRFFRVVSTLCLIGITLLINTTLGFDSTLSAHAKAMTPEAEQYQVDGNPFQAEQDAGKENLQDTANRLFKENKRPLEAPETTQKIGEALTKPAKATKQKLEEAKDKVQEKTKDAYNNQQNQPAVGIKNIVETVQEKLNLDQPIYSGTKEFINDVQDQAEKIVK